MDHYDEDLSCNQFFTGFQANEPLFQHVTSQRCIVAAPRCGSLLGLTFSDSDYETHTLCPSLAANDDDKLNVFTTLNGKKLSVAGNKLCTGCGFDATQTVSILFEEVFFNSANESYRVWCISQPLGVTSGSLAEDEMSSASSPTSYTLEDCTQVFSGSKGNIKLKHGLSKLLTSCQKTLSRPTPISLPQLKSISETLFTKAMSIVLKDPTLKRDLKTGTRSQDIRQNVAISLEMYLIHNIYSLLLRHISTLVSDREAQLNRLTRNIAIFLEPSHLNISSAFFKNIPRARRELTNLSRYSSARPKLCCLRRVVNSLLVTTAGHDGNEESMSLCGPGRLSTDDLLPILVYLVINTELASWCTEFTVMSQFCLTSHSLSDEFKFYLATLEAAIQHIVSGQVLAHVSMPRLLHDHILQPLLPSLPMSSSIQQFFTLVMENSVDKVEQLLLSHQQRSCRSDDNDGGDEVKLSDNNCQLPSSQLANGHLPSHPNSSSAAASETKCPLPSQTSNLARLAIGAKVQLPSHTSSETKGAVPPSAQTTGCHPLCRCERCSQCLNCRISNVETGPDVFSTNQRGLTALHVTALCGHVELADHLVKHGSVLTAVEYQHGMAPIHLAALAGHQAIIVLLVHHNAANISLVDSSGNTPLHWAALNGHESCAKALVYINQDGLLDINRRNDVGNTALHLAVKWAHQGVVDILLENSASVNVKNRLNRTPAQCTHNINIVKKLSAAAANVIVQSHLHPAVCPTVTESEITSSSLQVTSDASLQSNHFVSATVHHDHEPDDDYVLADNKRLMSEADKRVDKLLKFVADNDIQMVKYQLGWLEMEQDNPDIADIDITKTSLCHPLCQCSHCYLYQQIVGGVSTDQGGVHVNSINVGGLTSLHVAVLHGHVDMVRVLLRHGAHVNVQTYGHLNTPLHYACRYRNPKMARLLLQYGADVNAVNDVRNTPLHVACQSPQLYTTAFYLVLMGAALNAVNAAGDTALQCAVRHYSDLTAHMLLISQCCDHPPSTDHDEQLKHIFAQVRSDVKGICIPSSTLNQLKLLFRRPLLHLTHSVCDVSAAVDDIMLCHSPLTTVQCHSTSLTELNVAAAFK